MRKLYSALTKISGLVFVLFVWQVVSNLNLLEPALFPSPAKSMSAFANLFIHNNLLKQIFYTLQRMFSGFLIAAVLGVLLGLILGVNKFLNKSLEWLIDFFGSIPVVTLYPIFILLFGIHDESKIAMIFWATIWVITLKTTYGIKHSNEIRREVAKVYGANKIQSLGWITFYEALPQILVGMRIAISYALLVVILCEMYMGSNFGIGQKIYESNVKLATPELYALAATTGILGILLNRIFVMIERKMIPWAGKLS